MMCVLIFITFFNIYFIIYYLFNLLIIIHILFLNYYYTLWNYYYNEWYFYYHNIYTNKNANIPIMATSSVVPTQFSETCELASDAFGKQLWYIIDPSTKSIFYWCFSSWNDGIWSPEAELWPQLSCASQLGPGLSLLLCFHLSVHYVQANTHLCAVALSPLFLSFVWCCPSGHCV